MTKCTCSEHEFCPAHDGEVDALTREIEVRERFLASWRLSTRRAPDDRTPATDHVE